MENVATIETTVAALNCAGFLTNDLRIAHERSSPLVALLLFDLIGQAANIQARLSQIVAMAKE